MWLARFIKSIPLIKEKYPKAKWIFLTLTVRNCEITELRDTLTKMNAAWKRLTERKVFPALGFVKSVEVTRGQDGTAHPHFHCLLMVKPSYFSTGYISQEKWTELWKSCLRIDYDPIVNVKSVKVKTSIKKDIDSYQEALMMAALETFKYSVKGSDLVRDANWLDELTRQLHNTRSIAIGGCLREIISEGEPEDLIGEDIKESSEQKEDELYLLFDWASTTKRYQRRQ
jgi:plasmid rolling circle replication initiator protein Rep